MLTATLLDWEPGAWIAGITAMVFGFGRMFVWFIPGLDWFHGE
jgi:hypothetical protein